MNLLISCRPQIANLALNSHLRYDLVEKPRDTDIAPLKGV